MNTVDAKDEGINLSIKIDARPETVFEFMATAEGLSKWFGCEAQFEPKVGTSFRMNFPHFATTVEGEVVEIIKGRRLVLTWGMSQGPRSEAMPKGSTRVTLEVESDGAGCRVTLLHELLPNPQEEKGQKQGWTFHLTRLELLTNRSQLGEELPGILDDYFKAWSTDDVEERKELFEKTCTADVLFADDYAVQSGVALLTLHAANSRFHMPGLIIARVGEPVVCRGEALVHWEATGADGRVSHRGTNHLRITAEGKLARVVGFWSHPPNSAA